MEQPLIIIGSARPNGNTKKAVRLIFADVAYQEIDLLDFQLFPYDYEERYPATDRFDELVAKILIHQTIIFATPVYWYAMSGIMKTFFDRLTDLVTTRKEIGHSLSGKTSSLIACGTDPELPDGFEIPFKLTSNYLEINYKERIYLTEDQLTDPMVKQKEINDFLKRLN